MAGLCRPCISGGGVALHATTMVLASIMMPPHGLTHRKRQRAKRTRLRQRGERTADSMRHDTAARPHSRMRCGECNEIVAHVCCDNSLLAGHRLRRDARAPGVYEQACLAHRIASDRCGRM
jgi:hypothetical protein